MASRSITHFFRVALIGAAVVPSSAVVANPTGTCQPKDNAKDNGARPMYHSPGADDTYLPDCNAPLNREYWRVFAMNVSSAYVIPRMDSFGLASKYGMCTGDDNLSSLFKKYRLCKGALDSADIEVLNNMKPADALEITHALHKRLCFQAQATGSSWSITPWGPEDDIMDVCNTTTDAAAASYCDKIKKHSACTGPGLACVEMAITPSAEALRVIVPGLNKLYGTQCAGLGLMSAAHSQTDDRFTSLLSIGVLALLHHVKLHL